MTISSSLNASVAGLMSNATRLATISDNIANASTYGYKRAVTDFHSMVIEHGRGGYSAGGVRTTNSRLIDQRGSLVATNNPTDLAVRGRGMLPVTTEAAINVQNGDTPLLLATTGSFRPDDQGYMRSPAGMVLMGWPADNDGNIPTYPRDSVDGLQPVQYNSAQFPGGATTSMELAVNLPSTSTTESSSGDSEILTVEYYDNLGNSASLSVTFIPTVPAPGGTPTNEWTMTISDSASAGAVIGEYVMQFDDTRGAGGTLSSVSATTGGPYDPATGFVAINVAGGPMDLGIGLPGESTGFTQLSSEFSPVSISKDGTPVGNMIGVEVDPNGFVRATFDTGVKRVLYQVPLVDVSNINGLETLDGQSYRVTPDSGSYFLWDAGDGPTGDIIGYAREESATDVAGELTQLIQTQRAYSSNAKVIQTVDEMLQETTNIKR